MSSTFITQPTPLGKAYAANDIQSIAKVAPLKVIPGGVCASRGFKANGVHCGIRKNKNKLDLALVTSDVPASAAGVYTTNLVMGAPNVLTKQHLENGKAQAAICNSGIANTCNANGLEVAQITCDDVAATLGISAEDVIVASTGVIGQPLNPKPIADALPALAQGLSETGNDLAAQAIMTTDTTPKQLAVEFEIDGVTCHIGGMAKGSGMIHPNMATMLVFITSDCAIAPEMLQHALSNDIAKTFNMLSIDGDTSTNDMVTVMANGMAGNTEITQEGAAFDAFMLALNSVTAGLCRMIAGDGEGATKLLECRVTGASNETVASTIAKSVICSSLVKTAMFGADANWGRVLCAIGYSGAAIDVNKVDVSFVSAAGCVEVCKNGAGIEFSEEIAKQVLLETQIDILIELNSGTAQATAWGCDLTYDYVQINGDYRT